MIEIKITYNLEELKFHLQHIHKMCSTMDSCENCPFFAKRKYLTDKSCFFTTCSDGRVPMEWDFNELKEEVNK